MLRIIEKKYIRAVVLLLLASYKLACLETLGTQMFDDDGYVLTLFWSPPSFDVCVWCGQFPLAQSRAIIGQKYTRDAKLGQLERILGFLCLEGVFLFTCDSNMLLWWNLMMKVEENSELFKRELA